MNDSWLEQHVPRVYRFALRLAGEPAHAEDLTQETMLRAWRSRETLRDVETRSVWLLRITHNLWRDELRRRRREPASGVDPEMDEAPSLRGGKQMQSRERVSELLDRVNVLLMQLPPRQREVLHLAAYEGLTNSQIASVLDITPNAVKASLSLARRTLRGYLAEDSTTATRQLTTRMPGADHDR